MRYRPPGITDQQVRDAVADGWGFCASALDYAPVGAGSYNWIAADATGNRRFVKVDDLDGKPWLGSTRPEVLTGLGAVMTAAVLLREQGLAFVVAPLPMPNDGAVTPLDDHFTVSVYPYLDGVTGGWGDTYTDEERAELTAMLHELHQSGVPAPTVPIALPGRAALDAALSDLARPWSGPHAEDARLLLTRHETCLHDLLESYDEQAELVNEMPKVLTHGEPHPGNIMRVDRRLLLLDWDTVGMAPAERDMWLLTPEPDTEGAAFYRLRWALTDVALFAADLHAATQTPEAAGQIWAYLKANIAAVG